MEDAVKSREAVQDRYDAEYENEIYNLKKARSTGKRKLYEEDIRRDTLNQVEILTQQLSRQLIDEKTAGETELRRVKDMKSAGLASSRARTAQALNEIG